MHLLDEFSEKCEYCGYAVISKESPLFVVSCFNLTNANKCVMSVFLIGWKNRVFYEDRIVESSTAKSLLLYILLGLPNILKSEKSESDVTCWLYPYSEFVLCLH